MALADFVERVYEWLVAFIGPLFIALFVRPRAKIPSKRRVLEQSSLTREETKLISTPATELARQIRAKEVTSVQVVSAFIKRIREVNSLLNLLVRDRYDEALLEAKAVDERIANGKNLHDQPFLGVPVTIKECFAVKGMPWTAAFVPRVTTHKAATEDATVVVRLKKAGCIVLGVSNLSELLLWMESNSSEYGRALNPYDPERTPGGSSGGEGGLVGSGASVIGLGSDVGGSIRVPANFCGVFGHKPTGGIVPQTGHWPQLTGPSAPLQTYGPICRYACDLYPMLRVIAGPDNIDKDATATFPILNPAIVNLKDVHVLSWESLPIQAAAPVAEDIKQAQKKALDHLIKVAGCRPIENRRPHGMTKQTLEFWSALMAQNTSPPASQIVEEAFGGFSPVVEAWCALLASSVHTFPTMVVLINEKMRKVDPQRKRLVQMADELARDMKALLGPTGVLLLPVYPTPAPHHGYPVLRPANFCYSGLVNVLGFPSTAVPLALTRDNIPVGIQVISSSGNDHLCIAVALELERAFGGWKPPVVRPLVQP